MTDPVEPSAAEPPGAEPPAAEPHSADHSVRRRWLSVLAKASPVELERLWRALPAAPTWQPLRAPETGMVMVRGRAGGTGRRFNLGEMTVTRSAVRLDDGATGFGYVAGRDHRHAERAAVVDALMQDSARRAAIEAAIIGPLEASHRAAKQAAGRKAAATKVDFLTLVRGD